MIRTVAISLLLAGIIGLTIYSEIRQRAGASRKHEADLARQEQETETYAANRFELMDRGKIDAELLNEASWGRTEKVKLLLDSGADINARDTNGDTPLISAAFNGFSETVRLLLERGADVNAKNNAGNTALIEAASNNNSEIVALLLINGADLRAVNVNGLNALDVALKAGHMDMVRLLDMNGVKSSLKPSQKPSIASNSAALLQAVMEGDAKKVKSLLALGADVNARDKNGQTALMLATMRGEADVVEALLKGGANPDIRDKDGRTAMSIVRELGHVHIGRLLKRAGARVPSYNQIISTP